MNFKNFFLSLAFLLPLPAIASPSAEAPKFTSFPITGVAGVRLGQPIADIPNCPSPTTCKNVSALAAEVNTGRYELTLPAGDHVQLHRVIVQTQRYNAQPVALSNVNAFIQNDWLDTISQHLENKQSTFAPFESQIITNIVVVGDFETDTFEAVYGPPSRANLPDDWATSWRTGSRGNEVSVSNRYAPGIALYFIGDEAWETSKVEFDRATRKALGFPSPAP